MANRLRFLKIDLPKLSNSALTHDSRPFLLFLFPLSLRHLRFLPQVPRELRCVRKKRKEERLRLPPIRRGNPYLKKGYKVWHNTSYFSFFTFFGCVVVR